MKNLIFALTLAVVGTALAGSGSITLDDGTIILIDDEMNVPVLNGITLEDGTIKRLSDKAEFPVKNGIRLEDGTILHIGDTLKRDPSTGEEEWIEADYGYWY
jgi:hypothetical protein